jgi:hypothetical protein
LCNAVLFLSCQSFNAVGGFNVAHKIGSS